jgi:low affinity iron permease
MGNGRHRKRSSVFDRFAEAASEHVSHATFFLACLLLVVLWLPSYFIFRDLNTWQLVINTATTIVTFLLVALLQNSQRRSDQAIQTKLDALADGMADLMVSLGGQLGASMEADVADLREAVGIEDLEARPAARNAASTSSG